MSRQIVVVPNPAAGRGRAAQLTGPVCERLEEAGLSARCEVGRDATESGDILRRATQAGVDGVVVVGGDGMVQLALQAMAGSDVPLGVIPTGGGNDLARALGIPRTDPLAATDLVIAGIPRPVDLGRVGDRWFGTILCAGFDSRVAERVEHMSWPRGRLRYDVAVVAELRQFRPTPFSLELDGEEWRTDAVVVAVGNTPSYGGGLRMCEGADPADGLLDVTVVAPLSLPQLARLFPKLSKGTHVSHPAVQTRRARQVKLEAPQTTAYADGERMSGLPLTVDCVPGAIGVFAPPR